MEGVEEAGTQAALVLQGGTETQNVMLLQATQAPGERRGVQPWPCTCSPPHRAAALSLVTRTLVAGGCLLRSGGRLQRP